MTSAQGQVKSLYRLLLEVAGILTDVLNVLTGRADNAQSVDLDAVRVSHEGDVAIVWVAGVL